MPPHTEGMGELHEVRVFQRRPDDPDDEGLDEDPDCLHVWKQTNSKVRLIDGVPHRAIFASAHVARLEGGVTVLSILRQGIGLQQSPPNMLIVSLALCATGCRSVNDSTFDGEAALANGSPAESCHTLQCISVLSSEGPRLPTS